MGFALNAPCRICWSGWHSRETLFGRDALLPSIDKTNSIETAPFKLVFQLKRAVLIWPDRSRIYLQQTDIQLVQEVFPGQKPEHSRFLFPYRILLI